VREQLTRVNAPFDPATRVEMLPAAQRQQLEIAKALASHPKVLVLDEPTEALTETETEELFQQVERITQQGTAVVYISHRLPEVKRIADRVTVLRDGEIRGTFGIEGVSERELLDLIIGRSIDHSFPDKAVDLDDQPVRLQVQDLRSEGVEGVDLEVRRGEIVGFAGVEGNGQRTVLRALAGLVPATATVSVDGTSASIATPAAAQDAGIVYLPGDRQTEGLFMGLGIRNNISTLVLDDLSDGGFVSRRRERELAQEQIDALSIRTPSMETDVRRLSGGNAQKVLFARSLVRSPKVLLADEPTRGVDAGARLELYRVLRRAADAGSAVVVLSSDALELQGLADRVVVFSRGSVARTLTGPDITEDAITTTALTAASSRKAKDAAPHRSAGRLRRWLVGDYAPAAILLLLTIAFAAVVGSGAPRFLGERNLEGMMFLASALALTALGQLVVLLTGGIDLSAGPMMGVTVVILSFFTGDDQGGGALVLGLVLAALAAAVVGLLNGVLIRFIGLTPVITTVAMSIALLGIGLLLRPTPDGYYSSEVTSAIKTSIGPVPVAFLAVVVLTVVAEFVLRRTRFGIGVRAVGSDEATAHRQGARSTALIIASYVLCSLFAAGGGLVLAAQVGVGDSTVGTNYTLTAISAVVLSGASIFGGRGSFVSVLIGVILLQAISSGIGFLKLGPAWQFGLPGLLILVAAAVYSTTRASVRPEGARRRRSLRRRIATGTPDQTTGGTSA
jgi:ribose transport system ATP-binding protein